MREISDHQGRKFKTCTEMCKYWDVDLDAYKCRVHSLKWSKERALTTPVKTRVRRTLPTTDHKGQAFESFEELAKNYGMCPDTLKHRLKGGMSLKEALTIPVRRGQHVMCKDHLGNVYWTFTDMCKFWGVNYSTFVARFDRGLSVEECLKKDRIYKKKID